MAKVLKTAAIIVGVAAIAVATYGAALGPTAAAAAGSAGIGSLSVAAAGTILGVAAGALSIAATLTAKKPKRIGSDYARAGSPEDFVLGDGP